jgi:putative ABC transport system substrate-binding protein
MDRRRFLAGTGAALAAPLAVPAQQAGTPYRVGYLSSSATVFEPFRNAMRELGYIEGRKLVIDARLAAGKIERLPALAAELVSARVDVIAAVSPPAIKAAKEATTTIPIVMAFISVDPVQSGFVQSLGRPGGNITGVAIVADDIAGKRLALLKEMLPRATRMALLAQVNHSSSATQARAALRRRRRWASSWRSQKSATHAITTRPLARSGNKHPASSFSPTRRFSTIVSNWPPWRYDIGWPLFVSGGIWPSPGA